MQNPNKIAAAQSITIEGETAESLLELITVPADGKLGDYALPCFSFSKKLRKSPILIAKEAAEAAELAAPIVKAEAVNGYINFFVDKKYLAEKTLNEILEKGSHYGDSDIGKGKTVCIDYSSINIAKPFHIGHLLTTVIGGSLYKIYKKLGYKTVGINHLGDWGTQFGKLIAAIKLWGNEDELEKGGMAGLTALYVRFHKEAEKDSSLEDAGRRYFKSIEDGDENALALFKRIKDITLKEVESTYKRLKIRFDSYNGEAFYNDKMQPVLDELTEKKLLTESEGAKVVDLTEYGMPPCLLLRSDNATLYATRDLAAAFYRKKRYNFDKCLYVVAYQQNLHFRQVFKVLELMGKDWDMEHVAFGMVSLEDGAMSTREGKVVLLEDVLNRASEKALTIIKEKSPNLAASPEVAEQVGVGAVIFSVLYNNRIKDMVFSYDKILNFDGETAPYVQYTNARCNSVLKKAKQKTRTGKNSPVNFAALDNDESAALIALLDSFPEAVHEAAERNEPCAISRHLVRICQAFNKFYFEKRILNAEDEYVPTRIRLVKAAHIVIEEGLSLLGISAPKEM